MVSKLVHYKQEIFKKSKMLIFLKYFVESIVVIYEIQTAEFDTHKRQNQKYTGLTEYKVRAVLDDVMTRSMDWGGRNTKKPFHENI